MTEECICGLRTHDDSSWVWQMIILIIAVLVLIWALEVQWNRNRDLRDHLHEQRFLHFPCGRCGTAGSTREFSGADAYPNFYPVPLRLCDKCTTAQRSWLHHRFMLATEKRLRGGRAELIRVAEQDFGDRGIDMVALLFVAGEDIDLARRVMTDESFAEARPWLEGNLQRGVGRIQN